jgi:hypothetical protein
MQTLTVTTPPASLAVTLAAAKTHLRVDADFAEDDAAITALVRTAADLVGVEADATLVPTTYTLTLDGFPDEGGGYWNRAVRRAGPGPDWLPQRGGAAILLPRGPLGAVAQIAYTDADGVERTVDPSTYVGRVGSHPARVAPAIGHAWPRSGAVPDCVRVRYTAGYTAVPDLLAHAVLLTIGTWYENRETAIIGTIVAELPRGVKALINAAKAGGSYR